MKKTIPLDISEEGYNTQSIVYKWHDGNIYKINHGLIAILAGKGILEKDAKTCLPVRL